MSNALNKKLAELLGKMDEKVLQTKINAALDMLKDGNKEDLAKKIGKIDKNELMSKLNELDDNKLKDMSLNKSEMQQKLNSIDMDALQNLLGDQGSEIVNKIKDIIK